MTTSDPVRVLIADDQALLRGSFRVLIETTPGLTVVGEAGDRRGGGRAGRTGAPGRGADGRPDAGDGRDRGDPADLRIRRRRGDVRVLILTTFDLDEYVYAALRAGASGFLLKDTPPADLLTAIRVVAAGEACWRRA